MSKTNDITKKELLERLISLEVKSDLLIQDNKIIMNKVFSYVLILTILSIINILIHAILMII